MKRHITYPVALAAALTFGAPLFAVEDAVLQPNNFVDITTHRSQISVRVSYPGVQGRACGIELRSSRSYGSSAEMKALADALEVDTGFFPESATVAKPQLASGLVRYDFSPRELSTYLTRLRIRTRSGEGLDRVIRRALPRAVPQEPAVRVIAQLVDCAK